MSMEVAQNKIIRMRVMLMLFPTININEVIFQKPKSNIANDFLTRATLYFCDESLVDSQPTYWVGC